MGLHVDNGRGLLWAGGYRLYVYELCTCILSCVCTCIIILIYTYTHYVIEDFVHVIVIAMSYI